MRKITIIIFVIIASLFWISASGWVDMDIAPGLRVQGQPPAFEKTLSLTTKSTSDWVLIPHSCLFVMATVSFSNSTAGTKASIGMSTDGVSDVKAGKTVTMVGYDEDYTSMSNNTFVYLLPITAVCLIKATTNTGRIKMTIRAR